MNIGKTVATKNHANEKSIDDEIITAASHNEVDDGLTNTDDTNDNTNKIVDEPCVESNIITEDENKNNNNDANENTALDKLNDDPVIDSDDANNNSNSNNNDDVRNIVEDNCRL